MDSSDRTPLRRGRGRTLHGFGRLALALALWVAPTAAPAGANEAPAAQDSASAPSDEQVLLDRARAYWKARAERSRDVLTFYAPPELGGPTRGRDISEFGNVGYKAWQVEGVEIDGDRAIVNVSVQADFPLPTPREVSARVMHRTLREEWLKVGGTWYKKPVPLGLSHAFQANREKEKAQRAQEAQKPQEGPQGPQAGPVGPQQGEVNP